MAWTDKQIIEFANEFREGILDGGPSEMMCFAICAPLVALLQMSGVPAEMVKGAFGDYEHYWLKLRDGRVLDPTADQFNALLPAPMPPVYLGAPTKLHGAVLTAAKGKRQDRF